MATEIMPTAGLEAETLAQHVPPSGGGETDGGCWAAGGFRPTVAQVYEAEFDYVYRCLQALGVRGDLTDDALQDVFMVVHDKLAQFDGRARLRTWLYAIVLRVARRYRERVARDASRFVSRRGEGSTGGEQVLLQSEQLDLAQRALAYLDHPKREVFVLAMVEQCSAPEIATITGLPLNTVYSRLRAARTAFGDAIRDLARERDRSSRRRS